MLSNINNLLDKKMSESLNMKLMDFIDDVVLKFITTGTNETYTSYKQFMEKKILELKENPEKANDITNIIPALKIPENEQLTSQLQSQHQAMVAKYKVAEIIETEKKIIEKTKELKEQFMKSVVNSMFGGNAFGSAFGGPFSSLGSSLGNSFGNLSGNPYGELSNKIPSICVCGKCHLDNNTEDSKEKTEDTSNESENDSDEMPDLSEPNNSSNEKNDSSNEKNDTKDHEDKSYSFTIPLSSSSGLSSLMSLLMGLPSTSEGIVQTSDTTKLKELLEEFKAKSASRKSSQSEKKDSKNDNDKNSESKDTDDKINISI